MTRDEKMSKRREAGKGYKYVALNTNDKAYTRKRMERLNKNNKRTIGCNLSFGAGRAMMVKATADGVEIKKIVELLENKGKTPKMRKKKIVDEEVVAV